MWACVNEHIEVVNMILDYNIQMDYNAKDQNGFTAFMWSCKKGLKDVVKSLLRAPSIDIDAKDNTGRSGLMLACEYGKTKVVETILDHAKANQIELNTALFLAIKEGYQDISKLLKDHQNLCYNSDNKNKDRLI